MISVIDALRRLQEIAPAAARHPRLALYGRVLADAKTGQFYVHGLPGVRDVPTCLTRPGLLIHAALFVQCQQFDPFQANGLIYRFSPGAVTTGDERQLAGMYRLFARNAFGPNDRADLDRMSVPPQTTFVLFTAYRRGDFLPFAWINRMLTPAQGLVHMHLALAEVLGYPPDQQAPASSP